jgi:hypothetical protein
MKHLFEMVKRLLINPKEAVSKHLERETTLLELFRDYVLFLCLIPAAATLLCLWGGHGDARFGTAIVLTVIVYIYFVFGVWLNGFLIHFLAPRFKMEVEPIIAYKISALMWTPFFVVAVLFAWPNFAPITLLAILYGIYISYLGIWNQSGGEQDKKIAYMLAINLAMVLIWFVGYEIYRIGG